MKVGVIVQARMGSTRLKGKVLKELSGRPVLWHVVERLKHSKYLNEIIIATTENLEDNSIVDFCSEHKISCFRGEELDVLKRYYDAAQNYKLDIVVRVTSDCPLIDPQIVDSLIKTLVEGNFDYVSNSFEKTFAKGLECSAFTFEALKKCMENARKSEHREHVVLYMRENINLFKTFGIKNSKDESDYRITLDEIDDYRLLNLVYERLYKENSIINVKEALIYIEENNLKIMNAHVEQKS